MTCPINENECDIKKQLENKRKEDLKNKPKTIRYAKGFRSANWQLQYDKPKEFNKC
jgi:hypothetical protein